MKYVKPLNLLGDVLKIKKPLRGRLLGLDVGDKYVGLAISDPWNKVASPLSVLVRTKTNINLMAEDFQKLISEFSVLGFVVGFPFDRLRNGKDDVSVKIFIEELHKTGKLEDVKYTYWDECFTSKVPRRQSEIVVTGTSCFKDMEELLSLNVQVLLKPLNLHPVQAKTITDKFAAVGILQGYLDFLSRRVENESME